MSLEVRVTQGSIQDVESEAVVVNLFKGVTSPGGATGAVDKATGGLITRLIETGDFKGKLKELAVLYPEGAPFKRVIVAGLGPKEEFTLDRVRRVSAAVARRAKKLGVARLHTITHGAGVGGLDAEEAAQAVAEGAVLALYEFDVYKTGKEKGDDEDAEAPGVEELVIVERTKKKLDAVKRGAEAGVAIAESVNLTRTLATLSGDEAAPERLAERAQELAGETGLKVEVLDKSRIQALGMGGLLGVNRGSAKEPRFVVFEHNAGRDDLPTVVVVGKGVTFDTGGISIKPSRGMDQMRFDKSGACAVYGILRAAALLDVPLHVVGLTPLTDNMPGGDAIKPGDVLTAMNGKTIEVLNTDAEGRLILADALAYADQHYAPDAVVDLATLTGSVTVALGEQAAGLMGTSPALIERLKAAGEKTHERVWELPFYDEYDEQLESEVADVKNVGGRSAGCITAGKFLSHFVGDWPWAHLDIAGVAYKGKGTGKFNPDYSPTASTGAGVRLVTQLLRDWEPLEE